MKLVYLAEDLRLGRMCAVAEMIDNFTDPVKRRQAVEAFVREAELLAALKNWHIPRIYDRFEEGNNHYLVMEYVEGITLQERVRAAGGRLSEQEAVDIAIQILETLEYLHVRSCAIIYRDLKPGNVMLTSDGNVKMIDFGIARLFRHSRMTKYGTEGYAPHEQYEGRSEERSDLYALGATLHEVLSGRTPIPFDFPPLTRLRPGCNKKLSDLIAQSLAFNVADRVASAREFKRRLEAIKAEISSNPLAKPQMANGAGAASSPCVIRSKGSVPEFLTSTASAPRASALPSHLTWVFDENAPKVAVLRDSPPPQTWIVEEGRRSEQRPSRGRQPESPPWPALAQRSSAPSSH